MFAVTGWTHSPTNTTGLWLVTISGTFDVACANDTGADRHGIVAGADGLMNPDHALPAPTGAA
ncbi:MAG: hypothetical protein ABI224_12345 [Acetobacteraceae bacterium]